MSHLELKSFMEADEVRTLPKTDIAVVNFKDNSFMRATFQPGWKWSECIKPTVETESCQAPHTSFVVSGRMAILMDDGTKQELKPGDIAIIPPGHDAWVVGNEACTLIDFSAAKTYGVM